jgi:hypothetical protein
MSSTPEPTTAPEATKAVEAITTTPEPTEAATTNADDAKIAGDAANTVDDGAATTAAEPNKAGEATTAADSNNAGDPAAAAKATTTTTDDAATAADTPTADAPANAGDVAAAAEPDTAPATTAEATNAGEATNADDGAAPASPSRKRPSPEAQEKPRKRTKRSKRAKAATPPPTRTVDAQYAEELEAERDELVADVDRLERALHTARTQMRSACAFAATVAQMAIEIPAKYADAHCPEGTQEARSDLADFMMRMLDAAEAWKTHPVFVRGSAWLEAREKNTFEIEGLGSPPWRQELEKKDGA